MISIEKLRKILPRHISKIRDKKRIYTKNILLFVQKNPYKALAATLFSFLILMILGNLFFAPKPSAQDKAIPAKVAHIYKVGSAPQIMYQGKVEKAGVIKIVAQTPGIVQSINAYEGQEVIKGTNILSLSTNYSGGNVLSIARQIAGVQLNTANDTYNLQKDTIAKQRKLADNNKGNTAILHDIVTQSTTDTQALLDLQTTVVNGIVSNISNLEQTNVGGINDAAILQAKQILTQYQAAMVQTRSAFGNLQVQSNEASENNTLLQYQITLQQLDLQEKNLNMSLQLIKLQYNMALVNEATMFPSAPFGGTVDKIFVHVGDNVNPGTLLAQISGFSQAVEVVANVPQDIAEKISRFEPSKLYIREKKVSMLPTYISKDATNGVLYSVIYVLDESFAQRLTDAAFINIEIPIGVADTTDIDPYIPLDAIVQTQEEAFVYIVDDKDIARVKKITLGQIQGRYVQVLSGLPQNAQVVLDRNVIEGDKISLDR
ncbi:MAG: hypothetical protein A3B38_04105 [Candidatus Levybacteria bacterium RIFCSPLOWO2_01_FULL_36_13]|nr:MAG: hypothetical protein A2684_01030 [Candidatus Levybacteria bacterium RIFCSPHIGHO2_01_FULL_36_15b]OGH34310.1 MAG: hypothetical protein A3B38_04105 [Candidatus Levybacteria bacterium RIFCSPLOWO2_01_FULL_36_13]